MYQVTFNVPETHVEQVKEALFKKGAGRIGAYEACAWQTLGQGQFRPLVGSHPYLGQQNTLETVTEYLVQTVCDDAYLSAVIEELHRVHPYEVPSYSVWKINDFQLDL